MFNLWVQPGLKSNLQPAEQKIVQKSSKLTSGCPKQHMSFDVKFPKMQNLIFLFESLQKTSIWSETLFWWGICLMLPKYKLVLLLCPPPVNCAYRASWKCQILTSPTLHLDSSFHSKHSSLYRFLSYIIKECMVSKFHLS